MSLGRRIKELRESKGLIQKELARKAGVSVQAVSAWETELRSPNAVQRKRLCAIFGVTEAELFGGFSVKINPEILEALRDPAAVKVLLFTHKSSQDVKNTIKVFLDVVQNLSPEKREAILTLTK